MHKQTKMKILILPILVIMLFLIPFILQAQEKPPLLKPHKTDTPPVIDGVLDDPVWQQAITITGFKTWSPDYGKAMGDKTIVYLAYDRENLYFAFQCFDSRPGQIKASVRARDTIRTDDWVGINLDTFNDQQSLHIFYCNPLGIQSDSRYEGGKEDASVDMVWYSEGKINDDGYIVEIKIPLKSVRFSHKELVEMAVIFERSINRLSEIGSYPPLDPARGFDFLTQNMPLLYEDVKHYRLFELLPALTYSRKSAHEEGKLATYQDKGDISLTAKYGITSDLIFDGTINPDFSQVEADAGQIDFNLRFALFFPETRPFFLEGLEKFNFGGHHRSDPLREIVHTRTIVNPLVGLKLNGKVGGKNVIASLYATDELPDSEEYADDYAHFAIFRYKRALSQDSFIGAFYTGRERVNGYNRVYGADGQFRVSKASILGFHFFDSRTHESPESDKIHGHIFGSDYMLNSRDWVVNLGIMDIAKNFNTETGYITRTGITRLRFGILKPVYPKSKILQRIDPMIHSYQTYDKFSDMYETMNSFDVRFVLPRSTMITVGYRYANEIFLDERFDRSGFRFDAYSQLTNQISIFLVYNNRNRIRYIADPYQGKGNDATAALTLLPTDNIHITLSMVYSDFFRSADSEKQYDYWISRGRVTYQVNKYLFFRGIVEYNSFYKTLMTDFLASFTYIPGTVIHFGYGSFYEKIQWIEGEYRPADNFLETERGFFFKASYLWRF